MCIFIYNYLTADTVGWLDLTNKSQKPHLSSRFAAAVLPSLFEAGVPVRPNDPVVQTCAINEAHGIFCTCACVVSGTAGVKVCHRLLNLHNIHILFYSSKNWAHIVSYFG